MRHENYYPRTIKFSAGELHAKIDEVCLTAMTARLVLRTYTMDEFMEVCLYNEILRRNGIKKVELIAPYFPYGRQDRVMQKNEPFSLRVFCNMVNLQKFHQVTTYDPHSDVTPALVNNCVVIPQWDIARQTLPNEYFTEDYIFVSPDAGAYKKLSKLVSDDSRIAIGVKNRDKEGKITHTDVFSPTDLAGRSCVIVDDICDGGKTFIELARTLKKKGAEKVILYVTHGIFAKGFDELKEFIDRIYTTNSFNNIQNEYLFVREII